MGYIQMWNSASCQVSIIGSGECLHWTTQAYMEHVFFFVWSNRSPNVKVRRLLGRVTPSRLWLNPLPNVKCSMVSGDGANIGWLLRLLSASLPAMQALSERLADFWQNTTQHRDLLQQKCTRVSLPCRWCLAPAILCAVSGVSQGDAGWVVRLFSVEVVLKPKGILPNQYRNHWASTHILHHSGVAQKGRWNLSHDLALHNRQHHSLTSTCSCSGPPGFAGCTVVEVEFETVWRFPSQKWDGDWSISLTFFFFTWIGPSRWKYCEGIRWTTHSRMRGCTLIFCRDDLQLGGPDRRNRKRWGEGPCATKPAKSWGYNACFAQVCPQAPRNVEPHKIRWNMLVIVGIYSGRMEVGNFSGKTKNYIKVGWKLGKDNLLAFWTMKLGFSMCFCYLAAPVIS